MCSGRETDEWRVGEEDEGVSKWPLPAGGASGGPGEIRLRYGVTAPG